MSGVLRRRLERGTMRRAELACCAYSRYPWRLRTRLVHSWMRAPPRTAHLSSNACECICALHVIALTDRSIGLPRRALPLPFVSSPRRAAPFAIVHVRRAVVFLPPSIRCCPARSSVNRVRVRCLVLRVHGRVSDPLVSFRSLLCSPFADRAPQDLERLQRAVVQPASRLGCVGCCLSVFGIGRCQHA